MRLASNRPSGLMASTNVNRRSRRSGWTPFNSPQYSALVLLASMVSVELGITVALIELTLGVVGGNVFDLDTQDWLTSSPRSRRSS